LSETLKIAQSNPAGHTTENKGLTLKPDGFIF